MGKITVIVPTFNEEQNIRACIEGVKWADEILIADSFSTDRTLEIAKEYPNVRIIRREYRYSTSQKNWAIPQAKHEWILIVDSDERVTEKLAREIKSVVRQDFHEKKPSAYWIKRVNYFLGKRIRFSGWQNDAVIRLFRKGKAVYEDKFVHGEMLVDGLVGMLKNPLHHYTIRTIDQYFSKVMRYTTWKAQDKLRMGKQVNGAVIVVRTFFSFFRNYVIKFGFLDGIHGLILCGLSAFTEFTKFCKLWEMKKRNSRFQ